MKSVKTIAIFVIVTGTYALSGNYIYAQNWEKTPMPGYFYSTIEKSEYGVLIGELDSRNRPEIFNGVYISKDFGKTFIPFGLQGRGITSISTEDEWAAFGTYFNENNHSGLFLYNFETGIWKDLDFPYQVTAIHISSPEIYVGTAAQGIWKSSDLGHTWENTTINSRYSGQRINFISKNGEYLFAGTSNGLLKRPNGEGSWEWLSFFEGKNIFHTAGDENIIVMGTYTTDGLYISKDQGTNWIKSETFGNKSVGGTEIFKGCIYAGKPDDSGYQVVFSCDEGNTWSKTGQISRDLSTRVLDLEFLFSDPDVLFASVNGEGISRINIKREYKTNPIFRRPWSDTTYPLLDYITSYLDHEYPLLGSTYPEPAESQTTTVNFLGDKATEPLLYYSSHNGTDFKLAYGTEVLAVDSGIAYYKYCTDCGHTIVVNHDSGYQSQYMHLQDKDLITKNSPVPILKGQKIGKVGLTGRTTGPHLHFLVVKDRAGNNTFYDDYPLGIVDPFGWQADTKGDPWTKYEINEQKGSESVYLWEEIYGNTSIQLTGNIVNTAVNSYLEINIPQNAIKTNGTLSISSYLRPKKAPGDYLPGTSFNIDINDIFGNAIKSLQMPLELVYHLENSNIGTYNPQSLAVYYYDEVVRSWVKLDTVINNLNWTLTATTDHLSNFAVFGNTNALVYPHTQVQIHGDCINSWYRKAPVISLTSDNPDNSIYYSFDGKEFWQQYTVPITYNVEGVSTFYYKSIDPRGVEEVLQEKQIKLHTSNKWINNLKITRSRFSM